MDKSSPNLRALTHLGQQTDNLPAAQRTEEEVVKTYTKWLADRLEILELWSTAGRDNNNTRLIVQWAQELQARGGTLNTTRKAWAGLRIAAICERRLDDARRLADARLEVYGAFRQPDKALTANLAASVSVTEATTAIALAFPSPTKTSTTKASPTKETRCIGGNGKGEEAGFASTSTPVAGEVHSPQFNPAKDELISALHPKP